MSDDLIRHALNVGIGAIIAAGAGATTLGRARRRILAELRRQLDTALGHIWDVHTATHQHNHHHHIDGEGFLRLPEVPRELDEPTPQPPPK